MNILKLLLPVIVPSWRFFDAIGPSARVQFALLSAKNASPQEWHEFRPRPEQLTLLQMLGRMIWNPRWNESLFLLSCAERLMDYPTEHSEDEILTRIISELKRCPSNIHVMNATHLQFRLVFVSREGSQLHQRITFHSRIQSLPAWNSA